MILRTSILVLFLAILPTASSKANDIQDRQVQAVGECLVKGRWNLAEPKTQARPSNYKAYYAPNSLTSWMQNTAAKFHSNNLGDLDKSGIRILAATVSGARELAQIEKLSPRQRICLSQCLSHALVGFDPKGKTAYDIGRTFDLTKSVSSFIEDGQAVCGGRARTYQVIAQHLGLNVTIAASSRHVFNQIQIASKLLSVDANDTSCYLWE